MKTILITGASGFIGTALQSYFETRGDQVIPLTRQNCDYTDAAIRIIIQSAKPDIFIHAAGNASVAKSYEEGAKGATVDLTQTVLRAIGGFPTRFVYLSSAAVYGNPQILPITEQSPVEPISPYGQHKLVCEKLVEGHAFARAPLIVRIFSIFGPGQHRLVLHELFRQFVDTAKATVHIKGTGMETRDYLSVDVFVRKLAALLDDAPEKGGIFNIASGKHFTILECGMIMKSLLHSPKDIICDGQEITGNPAHWQVDTSLYDQMVKTPISFDFGSELSKTLDAWKRQIIP